MTEPTTQARALIVVDMGMARELADTDFDVFVVTDACATPGEATHNAALASLGATFATLVETSEVLVSMRARA